MGAARKLGLVLACLLAGRARADQGWEGQIVSVTIENDAVVSSDRHYTQGSFLSYLSSDNTLPRWAEATLDVFPTLGYEPGAKKWGFGVGQEIYTPEDLQTSVLQVDDRPYAGWLFGRFTLQRRGAL